MNQELLLEILKSEISREAKEKILFYWLLPPQEGVGVAPIQKVLSETKSGSVKRPTKEQLVLKANPKVKEEQEEMERTLKPIVDKNE